MTEKFVQKVQFFGNCFINHSSTNFWTSFVNFTNQLFSFLYKLLSHYYRWSLSLFFIMSVCSAISKVLISLCHFLTRYHITINGNDFTVNVFLAKFFFKIIFSNRKIADESVNLALGGIRNWRKSS